MQTLSPIVCLMGPTAAGKTDLAIALVKHFPCFEIISVDSAMVYKQLNIGAAKPTVDELIQAPHHLINIRDITESYSAADFINDAKQLIEKIIAACKVPLLVGGTMLYFKALQQGLAELPAADKAVRDEILQQATKQGWDVMHQRLAEVDPESAERIHPKDPQRLQRALEVYYLTGKPLSSYFEQHDKLPYQFINLGLLPDDRSWLHRRIALRFEKMLEQGLVAEVKSFYQANYDSKLPALRTVGYRQVLQYLSGELSYEAMVEKGIIATRQLAKRQMTWLRSWPEIKIFPCDSDSLYSQVEAYLKKVL